MKKVGLILVIVFSCLDLFGQMFPMDRDKFTKQLIAVTAQSATIEDQEFMKKQLTPFLLSEANMSREIFEQMVNTTNLMNDKKLRFYPEIYQYVYATYSFCKNKQSKENYENWHKTLAAFLEGKTTTKAKDFIEFSAAFFDDYTITSQSNFSWKYIGGTFTFKNDKEPTLELKGGKLVCYLDNRAKGANFKLIDSVVIKKTEGTYFPMKNEFKGKGGVITWEKVGLDPDKVYAELLTPYLVNTKLANLRVDTVNLTTPQFSAKVKGALADKAYNINRDADKNNPQFRSFEKNLKLKDFAPGVDFEGGFKYEGAEFIGSGVGNFPAKLTIYNKKKEVFAKVYADLIINNNKKIFAENARAVIQLGTFDSIVHPSLFFDYFKENGTFEFTRGASGMSAAPFISSYHQLDMYIPKLTWEKDAEVILLTYGKELSEELKVATLESRDYFSLKQFSEMQGMATQHPLVALYNYCYKYDEFVIDEAKFAAAMNRTADQCRDLLIQMNSKGFIIHNPNTKKIIVTDKTKKFIDANNKKVDYDYIVFKSDLRQARMPAQYTAEEISRNSRLQQLDSLIKIKNSKRRTIKDFGTLDLVTLKMQMNAVEKVELSEMQYTFVVPDDEKISIQKNRNFDFKGWLRSGKIEIKVEEGDYDYSKNAVNLRKTDKTLLSVMNKKSQEEGNKFVFLNSFIHGVTGVLYVDNPENRSGNKKEIPDYPKLDIKNKTKQYYNDPLIHKGAYDSTRFYFALDPVLIDSLDNFDDVNMRFDGELVSAGIFPKFREKLKVMPDYSLGFVTNSPQGGYPFYETKAKYDNKIMLSNNGLQGSGKIEFVKSLTESAQFTFLPDSTIGLAKFTNTPSEAGVEFPDALGQKVEISYNPRKQYLNVYSLEDPILIFKDIKYTGKLTVKAEGMTGNGVIMMSDANLKSKGFKFKRWIADADTSDFNLKNKYAEAGEGALSFKTDNVKGSLDFKERKGNFTSNKGTTKTQFPLNDFYCIMDKYTWFMDEENISMEKEEKNINIDAGLGLATSNFFSINPQQDSLSLRAPRASFSLKEKTIYCDKVEYVDIADARIFPADEKVNIRKKANIDELVNSKIVANYVTKYHTFEKATTKILARRKYEAKAKYPYKDADGQVTLIDFGRIYVDSSFQTVADGEVKAEENFKLSNQFDYYGKVRISAANPLISFSGATRINHNCNTFAKSWMAFSAPIDPKNIQIPVATTMKTLEGESVTAGLVWRDSRNPDSVRIYPAFLSKLQDLNDKVIINASGVLQFNPTSKEFQISTPEKLANRGEKGNYLSLHTETCSLNGDGKIDLGMNYGDVEVITYGIVNYDNKTQEATMNITAKFNFPTLDKNAFEKLADRISANESLRPLDFNTSTLEQTIFELKDKKTADAVKNEFIQKGVVKNMPKEFEDGIVITGIKLKSHYDGLNNGLKTSVNYASIVNIYNKVVFKQVPFKAFFKQVYSGNVSGDKFQFDMDIPGVGDYYFDYGLEKKEGTLQIYTTDSDLQNAINALKEDKRKVKNYLYKISENSGLMTTFMRIFQ